MNGMNPVVSTPSPYSSTREQSLSPAPPNEETPQNIAGYNVQVTVAAMTRQATELDLLESVKRWAASIWSTNDGKTFFLRHEDTGRALEDWPSYSKLEVRVLAEKQLLLLAKLLWRYGAFARKVEVIAHSDATNEEKLDRIFELSRVDLLGSWWQKVPVIDGHGRFTAFVWPAPTNHSDNRVFETLRELSLRAAEEGQDLRLRDRPPPSP